MRIGAFAIVLFLVVGCGDGQEPTENNDNLEVRHFDTSSIIKTAEMLSEEKFWDIIARSLKSTHSQEEQEEFLIKEIEKLSTKDIIGFRLRTDRCLYDSYKSDIWCAGYIMNGGCSDDGFEYFRCWLISKGKAVFDSTKVHADYLVNQVRGDDAQYEFEQFWYVANSAFKNRTGKKLYDYIDESFTTSEGNYPKIDITWKESDPKSMENICPKLFAKVFKK